MSISLFQIALLVLLVSGIVRVGILIDSIGRFVRLFEGEVKEGSRLLFGLDIPGLDRFVRDEVLLGIVPYMGLIASMWFFDLDAVLIGNVSTIQLILIGICLPLWVILDIVRSVSIRSKINKLYKETQMLQKITGSALSGLKLFVKFRGGVRKTALRTSLKVAAGVGSFFLRRKQKEGEKPGVGQKALDKVEQVTELPGKIADKFTEFTQKSVDNSLQKRFEKYAERSTLTLALITLWGLLPAILLSIISIL